MRDVRVTAVSIDDEGRLHVFPEIGSSEDFAFVYRAARGVHWDGAQRSLYAEAPITGSYPECYAHIVGAIASEYGCRLRLATEVAWSNIPDDLKAGIVREQAD